MLVPSSPIHLLTTMSSPGLAPEVVISCPFFTLPTPVTVIMACRTARVISVCPPIIWTSCLAHSSETPCIISLISSSVVSGGNNTESRTPTGSAPDDAISFRVTQTDSLPISFVVPVMGSVDRTKISSSSSFSIAQSSPTAAPTSTSSLTASTSFRIDRFNILSLTLPIFIAPYPSPSSLS